MMMCAAIDKTYCRTWKEYQEIVKWAKETTFTCPNGIVLHPIDSVYEWIEESFDGGEVPIMNTSQSLDYFLIKYCPIKLVQDRMREVYDNKYIESVLNGTSEYDTFIRPESGIKVKMIRDSNYHNRKPFSYHNKYYNRKIRCVTIDVHYDNHLLWYCKDIDNFIFSNELGLWTSSSVEINCRSLKAIIRKINKWELPKGAVVKVMGRYVGETWKFIVK